MLSVESVQMDHQRALGGPPRRRIPRSPQPETTRGTKMVDNTSGARPTSLSKCASVAIAVCAVSIALASEASADPSFAADWTGSWHSGGAGGQATVHLVSTDPIVGTITIPGMCTADWHETQRISPTTRLVGAHVTSGPCGDNTWNVTFSPTSLTGVDNAHPGTAFSFTPA